MTRDTVTVTLTVDLDEEHHKHLQQTLAMHGLAGDKAALDVLLRGCLSMGVSCHVAAHVQHGVLSTLTPKGKAGEQVQH